MPSCALRAGRPPSRSQRRLRRSSRAIGLGDGEFQVVLSEREPGADRAPTTSRS